MDRLDSILLNTTLWSGHLAVPLLSCLVSGLVGTEDKAQADRLTDLLSERRELERINAELKARVEAKKVSLRAEAEKQLEELRREVDGLRQRVADVEKEAAGEY